MSPETRAAAAFKKAFGAEPDALIRAPGRVNLIGEHTDYNDGFVLPCAINFGTVVAISKRPDSNVTVCAADFNHEIDTFDLRKKIAFNPKQRWANYPRGVISLMPALDSRSGANIAIAGDIPQGAGLSSSASLEVAIGFAWQNAFGIPTDKSKLAILAQRAENDFVGCNCGIMDQLISARGEAGHALLIDCRSLETHAVKMPDALAVLIVHSGVERGLVESEYNTRRAQCEAAAKYFGVRALRDINEAQLSVAEPALDKMSFKRARHVITENTRALAAVDALKNSDLQTLGKLMAASHVSMRDDFEITTPAIDRLVEIMQTAIGGEGGARMTGGGFGGCCVALVRRGHLDAVKNEIVNQYRTPRGDAPDIFVCTPSRGVTRLELSSNS